MAVGQNNGVTVVIYGEDETGPAINSAGGKLLEFKQRGESAMGSLRAETREAKAGMAALGEEIGIAIPRHLRSALAEFDGLRKAFSAVAFGLELGLGIEVFDKLKEKIPEIADEIAGWGKVEQETYKQAVKDNQERIKFLEQIKQLQRQIVLDQLSGPARAARESEFLGDDKGEIGKELQRRTAEWQEATRALNDLQAKEAQLNAAPDAEFGSLGKTSFLGEDIHKASEKVEELRQEVDKLQQSYQKASLSSTKATGTAAKEATDAYNSSLKTLQAIEAQIAADGESEDQKIVRRYEKRIQEIRDLAVKEPSFKKQAAEDVEATQAQETAALTKYWDMVQAAMMKALAPNDKMLSDMLAIPSALVKGPFSDMEQMAARIKQVLAEVDDETEKVKTSEENYDTTVIDRDRQIDALRQKAREQLQALVDGYKQLAIASGDPKLLQNADEFEKKLEKIKVTMDSLRKEALQKLTDDTTNFFKGFLDGSKTGASAFADFGKAILATMAQIEARMIAIWVLQKALGWITSVFGGAKTMGEGSDEGLFVGDIGSHAGGGPVNAGDWSWVGENGPELVRFGSAATVIPSSASMAMAGGGGDTYHIDARGAQAGVSQEILNAIRVSHEAAVKRAQIEFRETRRRRP
jgi:F0F1-type ATP synthase membrane subunit b/b'